jgi:nitronate monooxygenase
LYPGDWKFSEVTLKTVSGKALLTMNNLPSLTLGIHSVSYPIIQGGMGIRVSGARLAAAVANAGGIGIISAVGLGWNSPYFDPAEPSPKQRIEQFFQANRLALIDELHKARELSPNGVIGINVMMAAKGWETLVETAVAHGANLIIAGAGLPLSLPAHTLDSPDVALVPIVSSVRAAKLITRRWQKQYQRQPDGFVVESPKYAGGHLGASADAIDDPAYALEQVVPDLVAYIRDEFENPVPVIAAGGVWNRIDVDRMLSLGASGVQVGTRFITTFECDADDRYKQVHLQAKPEDVMLVPSPVGLPGRAIRNFFIDRVIAGEDMSEPCAANCLQACRCRDARETYCIMKALNQAAAGDVDNGLIFSGTHAGRAQTLASVEEVMRDLVF